MIQANSRWEGGRGKWKKGKLEKRSNSRITFNNVLEKIKFLISSSFKKYQIVNTKPNIKHYTKKNSQCIPEMKSDENKQFYPMPSRKCEYIIYTAILKSLKKAFYCLLDEKCAFSFRGYP